MGIKEIHQCYTDFAKIQKDFSEVIDADIVFQYLTADWGEWLGLYFDDGKFSVLIGDAIGNEIDPRERPIAVVQCPGIGNIDSTDFTENFAEMIDGEYREIETGRVIGSLADVILKCCEDGDVTNYIDEITHTLFENLVYDYDH